MYSIEKKYEARISKARIYFIFHLILNAVKFINKYIKLHGIVLPPVILRHLWKIMSYCVAKSCTMHKVFKRSNFTNYNVHL